MADHQPLAVQGTDCAHDRRDAQVQLGGDPRQVESVPLLRQGENGKVRRSQVNQGMPWFEVSCPRAAKRVASLEDMSGSFLALHRSP